MMKLMRLYVYILLYFFMPFWVISSYADSDFSLNLPADYIIAGNLNHELGQRWLKARVLKNQGEFEQSRIQYVRLLEVHHDLIQARFEYVQVLQILGRFKEMVEELETLLELDPGNLSYRQFLGTLFLEHGQEKQGIMLLEDVWQRRQDVILAQLLYRNYTKHGLKRKSLTILEYLYKQSVNDVRLQDELFVLYIELGDDVKAQKFTPALTENAEVSLRRLILAAQLHERLGLDHLAADYWQAVLKKQPDYQLAHENLVRYYMANSREGEALPHKIFLYSHIADDGEIAGEIGDYYVKVAECSQAIFFLKRSLADDPSQVERLKGLAYCYAVTGEMAEAAQAFTAYFRLQAKPANEDRRKGAQVFVAAGLADDAVHQYRELLVVQPGDVELLTALAQVETSRGCFAEALTVWKQVAHLRPDDVDCRIQILSLSEKLGVTDVHSVLAEIHALDTNNHKVSLLLALAALKNGNYIQGMELFRPLADSEFFSADLLALRGEIFLLLNQPEHSFADFSEAFKVDAKIGKTAVLGFLEAAGLLGRRDIVVQLNDKYKFDQSEDLQVVLLYADSLAECGDFDTGVVMYQKILASDNRGFRVLARSGLARLYARHGFLFEAEQENRLNWLHSQDGAALLRLLQEALHYNKNGEAEYWLDQYIISGSDFDPAVYRADLQLLMAYGEFDRALGLADEFDQVCMDAADDCGAVRILIQLDRVQMLVQQDEIEQAQTVLAGLQQEYPAEIRVFVYALKMAVMLDDAGQADSLRADLLQRASGDAGDLFGLQKVAAEYGLFSFTRHINRQLYKSHPKSLKYGLTLANGLIEKVSFDEAIDVIGHLKVLYPDSLLVNLYGAKISLAMGEFKKGLSYLDSMGGSSFFKEELLRARLLWGLFKWDEALRVYENNLVPDAEDGFLEECEVLHVKIPVSPDPALWLRIVKPMASKASALEMSFVSPVDSGADADKIALVGTSFFAQKRWQDLFRQELSARRSVRKRQYFHAVNQYEAMGDNLNEPTLLFDLAGVYSNLNRVGDEAVVYEKINQINPDFPGLASAMNWNQLKRRPRTGITIQYLEENGWDGYKDIRQWKQNIQGWYSPKPRQEGVLSVSHLYYEGNSGETVRGNELLMGITSNVLDYFNVDMSGGVHILGDHYPNKGIYDISITGMAGDFFESYIGIKRRVIKDTIASLGRGVTVNEYVAQTTVDLFPRLQVGGKLVFADYSDENDMSGYSVWGVLALQTQPDYLYFRLGYEFIDHQNSAGGTGPVLDDGFQKDDHPYWSPVNYWRNQYMLGYKHTYSEDILGHQIPGFLSARYSLDYDSEGELFQQIVTGLHLEVTDAWLFSFDGSVDFSDEYDGFSVDCTLDYRW